MFHEHSTLECEIDKKSALKLICTTCGKEWLEGFQIFRKNDAAGNVTDRGILDSSQVRVKCDALDGANRTKDTKFAKRIKGFHKAKDGN